MSRQITLPFYLNPRSCKWNGYGENPVSMADAVAAYRAGNNAGMGYAPYTDVPGDDTIENAIAAAVQDGWEVVLPRRRSDEVALLRNGDGEYMAIGGDARGHNAWAVDVTSALR